MSLTPPVAFLALLAAVLAFAIAWSVLALVYLLPDYLRERSAANRAKANTDPSAQPTTNN